MNTNTIQSKLNINYRDFTGPLKPFNAHPIDPLNPAVELSPCFFCKGLGAHKDCASVCPELDAYRRRNGIKAAIPEQYRQEEIRKLTFPCHAQNRIPSAEYKEVLKKLKAIMNTGITLVELGKALGTSKDTLSGHVRGKRETMSRELAVVISDYYEGM